MPKKGDLVEKDGKTHIVLSVSKTNPEHFCLSEHQEFDQDGKLIKSGGKPV